MEAPDAKRPRLDHEPASYPPPSGHPLRPASTPVIPAPQHSHADHPPSAPASHTYPAPPSGPGPSAHHPAHPPPPNAPPGQPPRENGADPHRATTYPATGPPGPPDHQPGYGVGPGHHHLSYPPASQAGGAHPPPAGYGSRRTSSADRHPASMAEHQPHHGLPHHQPAPQYQGPMEPHVNGSMPPSGMQYHPQDQYPVGPVPHHGAYPPTPSAAYHGGPMYAQGPSQYVGQARRKQVRAQQACNQCRQRKQKCDENRPCGYCSNEGIGDQCQYKEVPPPKTDRHIVTLLDQQKSLEDGQGRIEDEMRVMRQEVARLNQLLQQNSKNAEIGSVKLMSPPEFPSSAPATYGSIAAGAITEDVKNIDPSADNEEQQTVQDSAPTSHETGAQYLVQWPYIADYFKNAGVNSSEYVMDETERSGTLRPYGWSHIENGQIQDPPSDDAFDEETREQNVDDPLEGMWGSGPATRGPNNPPNVGGGNPDGSLDLVGDTVWKLWDSYMRNMWVLHPFLDAKWLNTKIEEFVSNHSPASFHTASSDGQFAMPGAPASGARPDTPGSTIGKRKRQSNASEDTSDFSSTENTRKWQAPKKTPDRSMQNAIVLLVLALGKVLLEDRFLLEEFSTRTSSTDPSETSYANSPHDPRPSPRSHHPYESASSPGDLKAAAMARGASYEGSRPKRSRKNGRVPNAELYPGLAYFAHASDILGNNLGGNSIMHAQAFLLAGIYYGQLGRVTESWSWINEGLRVTTILSNKKKYRKYLLSRDEETQRQAPTDSLDPQSILVAILCWSALQLESDLRAELDQLPQPSQLMYSEPRIIFPPHPVGVGKTIELYYGPPLVVDDIIHSYHFQIHLRLTLNRTHTALYSTQSRLPHNRKKRTTVAWTDADTGVLFHILQNVRMLLGSATRYFWHDSEQLTDDLLEARLRAKYYGGEYIILRPYIYSALRWSSDSGNVHLRPPFDMEEWLHQHNAAEKAKASRRAFNKEHGQPEEREEFQLPEVEISYETFQNNEKLAKQFLWCCKRCIDSAMASTEVFDGVASPLDDKRLRVTNIHGTATAQFSNMLVLCAATRSWLAPMVDKDKLKHLMERTIALHERLSPLAPIFRTNKKVLQEAAKELYGAEPVMQRSGHIAWQSPGSFPGSHSHHSMSPASAGTPRVPHHQQPPPTSAHSSFSSARY